MKFPMDKIFFFNSFNLIIILYLFKFTSAIDYDYKDTNSWAKHWPTCGGNRQSPIDIDMDRLDGSQSNNKLKLQNYEIVPKKTMLFNNGRTVQIKYEWGHQIPTMSGNILNGKYRLDSLHFHWNSRNNSGSEHTFQGQRGVMELHYIHYNIKYGSLAEAADHDDGLMIVGDLFFTAEFKNATVESKVIDEVFRKFSQVSQPGSLIEIESFSLASLGPPGAENIRWVTYLGSITVPPCTENVVWAFNTFPHLINDELARHARESVQLKHHDDHNFREIQPLNGRKLFVTGTELVPPS